MRGKRSYGKSMGFPRRNFPKIKAKLKEADTKFQRLRERYCKRTKRLENPPESMTRDTDLQTEADRIKSARADIDEALRMMKADCAIFG